MMVSEMNQIFQYSKEMLPFKFLVIKIHFLSRSFLWYCVCRFLYRLPCFKERETLLRFFYQSEKSRSMNQITTSLQKPINNLAKFHTFNTCALLVYYVTFGFIVFAFCKEKGLVENHALFSMHCSQKNVLCTKKLPTVSSEKCFCGYELE